MKKPTYGIVPVLTLAALGLTLGACQQSPAPAPVVNVQPANSAPAANPPAPSTTVEHTATTSTSSTTTDQNDPNAPASTTTSTESKMSKKTTQ